MVTPAAQPVIISYGRHIRESVLLAAESLGETEVRRPPEIPLGLGTAPRPCFLRVTMEPSYTKPWGQETEQRPSVLQF